MNARTTAALLMVCALGFSACNSSSSGSANASGTGVDSQLAAYIAGIRVVDNHSHVNSVAAGDTDSDALPLDGIPVELPVPLRAENPDWILAYKALYQYAHNDLSDAHKAELHATIQSTAAKHGDKFPEWALDQAGTEVILANRIAMGPGLSSNRFRWVSYIDPLMFPLSNKLEGTTAPDRAKLFALEDKLLKRYLTDLKLSTRPATLDTYLRTVVTPIMESQRKGGCVAVKFEVAYLRSLNFAPASLASAATVYAKYASGGEPTHAEYTVLQDFLFHYIASEAGRLGMAVHLHSFEGFGNGYRADGADPMLLEPTFNDTTLRNTKFVIVHGGGIYAPRAGAMLWKPGVFVDMSMMTLAYPPERLSRILRDWLTQYPEKVLFGSDAVALGPDLGWEVAAWVANRNGKAALTMALSSMMRDGEITRERAQDIAKMVLRTNASKLYQLGLQ